MSTASSQTTSVPSSSSGPLPFRVAGLDEPFLGKSGASFWGRTSWSISAAGPGVMASESRLLNERTGSPRMRSPARGVARVLSSRSSPLPVSAIAEAFQARRIAEFGAAARCPPPRALHRMLPPPRQAAPSRTLARMPSSSPVKVGLQALRSLSAQKGGPLKVLPGHDGGPPFVVDYTTPSIGRPPPLRISTP